MLSVFTCTCKYTLHVRVSLVETIRLANQLSYMATYGHWAQKRSWLFGTPKLGCKLDVMKSDACPVSN